jgi:glycosyl transferase family 25
VRAYVINLARSPERRAHMAAELAKSQVDYEFFEAIDGRDIDLTDPRVRATIAPPFLSKSSFRPGNAACARSHLSVYKKIVADGLNWAMVMEDDVIVPEDLASLADAVAEHLVGSEVALLNFDSERTCKMSRQGAVDLPHSRQLVLPVDVDQPVSAAAYVITREACERMDERPLPIWAKADDWAHFYDEGVLDRVRCVVPLAVAKSPDFGSTMGHYSDVSLKARLLATIARYDLRFLRRVVSYRRKRIWRRYTRIEFVDEWLSGKPPAPDGAPLSDSRISESTTLPSSTGTTSTTSPTTSTG